MWDKELGEISSALECGFRAAQLLRPEGAQKQRGEQDTSNATASFTRIFKADQRCFQATSRTQLAPLLPSVKSVRLFQMGLLYFYSLISVEQQILFSR